MLQIFVNPRYDFISKRRWAYTISAAFVLVGLLHIAYRGGLEYGIDFAGGSLIQVRFERATTVEAVRQALDRVRLGIGGRGIESRESPQCIHTLQVARSDRRDRNAQSCTHPQEISPAQEARHECEGK